MQMQTGASCGDLMRRGRSEKEDDNRQFPPNFSTVEKGSAKDHFTCHNPSKLYMQDGGALLVQKLQQRHLRQKEVTHIKNSQQKF